MINERYLAEKFSVVWRQNFPLLTANFIKVINSASIEVVNESPVIYENEIRYDIVSEASFILSEIIINSETSPLKYLSAKSHKKSLFTTTATKIWKSQQTNNKDDNFTRYEINDIIQLTNNILEFIRKSKGKDIKFRPRLKGYGFLPDLEADLSIDNTLFEFKTVTRNFKTSDLKQLLIYLALNQVSPGEKWTHAGLYNPRKGILFKFNIVDQITRLSGGRATVEAFESFLDSLVRDIEFDSRF